MYDFPDSSAIFDIFEVGLANSHISVPNHLATPKLAIFEYWRPNWRSGGRQFANLALWRSPVRQFGDFSEYLATFGPKTLQNKPPKRQEAGVCR